LRHHVSRDLKARPQILQLQLRALDGRSKITAGEERKSTMSSHRLTRKSDQDGIYTRPDRDGYWITWEDAQGRRKRRKTDARTLTQAKNARSAEIGRAEHAKALGFSPAGEETFTEVAGSFLAYQKPRLTPAGYERERGIVEDHLKPFFNVPLRGVRRLDVQRYMTKRCGEVKAETARKELNTLKHLLKLAVEWEYIPINPAQGVKGPKAPAGRVRYLQPTELGTLLNACPDWLQPIVVLAIFTGMRRSEILKLRWLDVDIQNHRVLLLQTKNGEGRIVYLNQSAESIFKFLLRPGLNAIDPVFPKVNGCAVSVAFVRVCHKVGIADFRFHDLRHTAASWMRMQGADIHTVAQLLGHKDLRMAMRYQHLSPAMLSEAVNGLDGMMEKARHPGVTEPIVHLKEMSANA
jgi:integrase